MATKRASAPARRPAAPTGVFARIKAEADAKRAPVAPYVIDDVTPPIVIQAPDDTETQFAIGELMDAQGDFQLQDARRVLELICGDAYEQVWELVRREHISVAVKLITELGDHFGPTMAQQAADFPGGSKASSS